MFGTNAGARTGTSRGLDLEAHSQAAPFGADEATEIRCQAPASPAGSELDALLAEVTTLRAEVAALRVLVEQLQAEEATRRAVVGQLRARLSP